MALLDPELTLSLPPRITAHTGFDAFTHALEGYVSRSANLMTEPLSLNAIRLLHDWLPVAVDDPSHRAARCHCMIASMQAAIAYNTSQLGLCHALAAPLGAMFHVAHGLANAIALPVVTAFNESCLGEKAPVIAKVYRDMYRTTASISSLLVQVRNGAVSFSSSALLFCHSRSST